MSDLAVKTILKAEPSAGQDDFIIADGITMYEGMLCGIVNGYLNHWADGASDVFCGILVGGDSRLNDGVIIGETSDSPKPRGYVDTSGATLMHLAGVDGASTLTQADVGAVVYCTTSNPADITTNSSGKTNPIGIIKKFRSTTDIDVRLFSMMEFVAQRVT